MVQIKFKVSYSYEIILFLLKKELLKNKNFHLKIIRIIQWMHC
jgi:hypothetical protein